MTIEGRILTWLVRLPLQTEEQLAALCAAPAEDIEDRVARLLEAGWLERHTLADPRDLPVLALSAAALRRLDERREQATLVLGALPPWQLRRRALAEAIIAGPVTHTLNAFFAATARAIREDGAGGIVQAAHRPPTGRVEPIPGDPRSPLPWGHAEGRWREGDRETRFALFCDRPELPMSRRAALLKLWHRLQEDRPPAAEATLLILCSRADDCDRWLELYNRSAGSLPPMAFALQADVLGGCRLDDPAWQPASASHPATLKQTLTWRLASAPELASRADDGGSRARLHSLAPADRPLRSTIPAAAVQRAATCALRLTRDALLLIRLLARQPWLSAADIAAVHNLTPAAAAQLVAELDCEGAASAVEDPDGMPRWLLTATGMRLAAARAGEARHWRAFASHTSTPWVREGSPTRAPGRHDAGVSRTLGRLAAAAPRAGLRLDDWRSEGWWRADVSTEAPVPDATFGLRSRSGERIGGIVEYERLRGHHPGPLKIEPWVRWYEDQRWRTLRGPLRPPAGTAPVLLIVYDAAGWSVPHLLDALKHAPRLPIFAASEQTLAVDGLHAPLWQRAGGGIGPAIPASPG